MLAAPTKPDKTYQQFALEVCQRELTAISEGKIDGMFVAYALRVINRALREEARK